MQVLHKAGSWSDGGNLERSPPPAVAQAEVQDPDRMALGCKLLGHEACARHGAVQAVFALEDHDVGIVLGNNMHAQVRGHTCLQARKSIYAFVYAAVLVRPFTLPSLSVGLFCCP